jgi:hypothetical protein
MSASAVTSRGNRAIVANGIFSRVRAEVISGRPKSKCSKVHTCPRIAHGFQPSICIRLYNNIVQATSISHMNHENKHARSIGQGEAGHRQ